VEKRESRAIHNDVVVVEIAPNPIIMVCTAGGNSWVIYENFTRSSLYTSRRHCWKKSRGFFMCEKRGTFGTDFWYQWALPTSRSRCRPRIWLPQADIPRQSTISRVRQCVRLLEFVNIKHKRTQTSARHINLRPLLWTGEREFYYF